MSVPIEQQLERCRAMLENSVRALNERDTRIRELEAAIPEAIAAERERCAGIVVNDEHTMAHVKARLSNKIRGDA